MKRLAVKNINTPEEYARIWEKRSNSEINWFDVLRWQTLIKYFNGGRFIDLGCLDSLAPLFAKEKYPKSEVWGLDFVEDVIKKLSIIYPEINYIKGDVYETHFPSMYFDYVVAGELLEHLEKPEEFISEAFRILKVGGILALSTPQGESELGEVDKDRHLWSFTRKDINKLLEPYGSVRTKIIKSSYFPYRYAFPNIIAWTIKK